MRIGVPKEIKTDEYRVGLTPGAVREYVATGHTVIVETNAGLGIGAGDDAYRRAGATIADTSEEVFGSAGLIVKVKEPQPIEREKLRRGQILFTYLHLAPDSEQTNDLLKSGCTAVAYETVTDAAGGLPLLAPMSEVAGRLAIEAAGAALRGYSGGRGILLGGVPGVTPARIVIIGGGVVGVNAARTAIGLNAEVTIFDKSLSRLRHLDETFRGQLRTRYPIKEAIEEELAAADVVIGAVLVPGASAPRLVTRSMLGTMKRGAVIVDVAIDQGGCCETSKATTHSAPTYVVDGVIHYCVANMPGSVPLTSSQALNNATLPFGLALASEGLDAMKKNPHLRAGLNVHDGRITCKPVAESLGLPFMPAEELLQPH